MGKSEDFEMDAKTVESVVKRINSTKAMGPDNISGRLLKICASELCDIYNRIFNWSLLECSIPSAWQSSLICPVPKKKSPTTLNDYRPVALTSLVMTCFEKIVVQHLLTFTSQQLDPFQFAYKSHRGVDDAILNLLHEAFIHLDKPGSFISVLFIDFSSAFNTIQPHLLPEKLLCLNGNPKVTLWIVRSLLIRSQSIRF